MAHLAKSRRGVVGRFDGELAGIHGRVLFLDLLRQRGNEEIEITSRPMATVLLLGGSWLTALTSDLGNGKFDGTPG